MSWFTELQWDSEEQNYWKCLIENQGGSFSMSYYNQTQVSELSEMNMNYQNRTISKGSVFMYLDMTSFRHFCEADNYLLLGNGTVTATLWLCAFSICLSPHTGGLQKEVTHPTPDFYSFQWCQELLPRVLCSSLGYQLPLTGPSTPGMAHTPLISSGSPVTRWQASREQK